jgi:hypothetical protein
MFYHHQRSAISQEKLNENQKVLDAFFEKLDSKHVLKKWLYLSPYEKPSKRELDQYFESSQYYYYKLDNKKRNFKHEIRLKKEDFLEFFGFFVKLKSLSLDHQQFNAWVSQFVELFKSDSEWIYETIKRDRNLDRKEQEHGDESVNPKRSVHYKWFPYLYLYHDMPLVKHQYQLLCDALQKKNLSKLSEVVSYIHLHLERDWNSKRAYRNSKNLLDDIIMYFKIYEPEYFQIISSIFNQMTRDQFPQMHPDVKEFLFSKLKIRNPRSVQIYPDNAEIPIIEAEEEKETKQSRNTPRVSLSALLRNVYQKLNDTLIDLDLDEDDENTNNYKNSEQILKEIEDKIKLFSDHIKELQENNSYLEEERDHFKIKHRQIKIDQDQESQKWLIEGKEKQLIEMLSSMQKDYPEIATSDASQKWLKSFYIHPIPSSNLKIGDTFKISKQEFLEIYEDVSKQGYQNRPVELLNYGWKLLKETGEEKILVKALIDWVED